MKSRIDDGSVDAFEQAHHRVDGKVSRRCRSRWCQVAKAARVNSIAQAMMSCEPLESRRMLTGTWTTIANAVPNSDGAQNGMVLSDGTIMVHGGSDGSSAAWYKLTPSDGSYVNGTWSTLASMSLGRLFFASNVLPSGKVLVLGGEYTGPSTTGTDNNTGQIYDPVANTWSSIPNFPQSSFGDDPTEMLPNGDVLAGYLSGAQTYLYNPSTNAWSSAGTKLRGDRSDEESWVKLPDDSILSYDVFSSLSTGTPHAQRYYPSTNTWVDAGTPPAQLSASNVGYELGAGLLLPSGQVLFIGATSGRTAYYNYGTNTWSAGPTMPNNYVAADAPAAVLPNGDVLMAVSPQGGVDSNGNYNFPGPSYVYELNPTTGVYTNVTPSLSGFSTSNPSFKQTFLVLPSGQLAWFNESGKIAIYTESGAPNASWAPSITNITNNTGSNTFTLTGYQLNGISEGAAYGDDNEMASDYPIIQLTDQYGNITYARTFNWTLDGVASLSSSVSFTEPVLEAYIVNVIANGIASQPVLDIACSSTVGENFAVQPYTPNTNYLEVNAGENGTTEAYFFLPSFTELIMTGDAANNTLVLNDDLGGRPTIINGGNGTNTLDVETEGSGSGYVEEFGGTGTDYYDFSLYNENLSNLPNFTYVEGSATGNEQVQIFDNNYSTATTYTVGSSNVSRSGFYMYYSGQVSGVSLTTGTGVDTVDVQSTDTDTPVTLYGEALATVDIGYESNLQYIDAPVTVVNMPSYTTLILDDSADSSSHSDIYIANGSSGYVGGLAPATIYWMPGDINGITIKGGTGGNDFYIANADITFATTTIDPGTGTNVVQFDDGISGQFSVNGQGSTTVNIYDNLESSAQSWLVTSASTSRSGFSVAYNSIVQLTLDTGYGIDTVDIESEPCPTGIGNYGGQDIYDATTGSQNLSNITYTLTINGGTGGGALTLDNVSDPSANGPLLYSSEFFGIGAAIYYTNISALTYDISNAISNLYVVSTNASTNYVINGGANANEVNLGYGNLTNVQGNISFNPQPSNGSDLLVDDASSSVPISYQFSAGSVVIPGQLDVTYNNNPSFIRVSAGTGADTDTVYSTSPQIPVLIYEASGNDTVLITGSGTGASVVVDAGTGADSITVGATGGTLANLNSAAVITGQGGNDAVTINDLVDANFNVSSGRFGQLNANSSGYAATVNYSSVASLAVNVGAGGSGNSLTVYNTAAGTPVTVNNNSGTDTINVDSTASGAPVIVSPSGGSDPVNVLPAAGTTAVVEFLASQQIGTLTLGSGGKALVPTGPRVLLQASSIASTGTGTLDLTTNDMIVHNSNLSAVSALVASGYNRGAWTGAGITSSAAAGDTTELTALGTILNTYDGVHPIFSASRLFHGYAPSLTDILVKYTYYGDANLDGTVNGADYSLIDNGFLNQLSGWYNGDFNYDSTINGTDFTLIDNAYNRQGAGLASKIGAKSVVGSAPSKSPAQGKKTKPE